MLCSRFDAGWPCGQCLPCRINRRRAKATRIMLEAQSHPTNAFLTLTYDEEHVPKTASGQYTLNPRDTQLFWKKLRQNIKRKFDGEKIRYLLVGEYGHEGEREWNPHYHAALFNFGCLGKIYHADDYPRCHCSACELVHQSWDNGTVSLDELNDTTANYIAGYTLKKMTTPDDFRLEGRYPEFQRCSQGIGRDFVESLYEALSSQYGDLAFKDGDIPHSVRVGNRSLPLDRYLRNRLRSKLGLEKVNPETGEIGYGTPQSKIDALKKEHAPKLHALQEDLLSAPLWSDERKVMYDKLDAERAVLKLRHKQKLRNVESKFSIRGKRNETL